MVRATGLEPARLSQRNLNPPSLPIPPRPQIEFPEYFITTQDGCQLSRMLLSRMGKLYQKFRRFPLTFRQSMRPTTIKTICKGSINVLHTSFLFNRRRRGQVLESPCKIVHNHSPGQPGNQKAKRHEAQKTKPPAIPAGYQ